jgi:hypothetical protein
MLVLSTLQNVLTQVVEQSSEIHIAALLTNGGHLISCACDKGWTKDDVRVVVGISCEAWQETRQESIGKLESGVRHISDILS